MHLGEPIAAYPGLGEPWVAARKSEASTPTVTIAPPSEGVRWLVHAGSACQVLSYREFTGTLGFACSEPMMELHIKRCGFTLVEFPRCFAIDRT